MIYNLIKYLRTELPTITFLSVGENFSSEGTRITETGGDDNHNIDRADNTIQIISKNKNIVLVKQEADNVYNKLRNVFNLTLPEETVNSVVYPAIRTYRIVPIQKPGYIGADVNGLHMYSFNIIITTK